MTRSLVVQAFGVGAGVFAFLLLFLPKSLFGESGFESEPLGDPNHFGAPGAAKYDAEHVATWGHTPVSAPEASHLSSSARRFR